jgi:hypothetical protein
MKKKSKGEKMKDKYLPIGTIVLLKGGTKKVMITSYLIFSNGTKDKEKKMFDYGGCPYPEGIIESSYAVGFDHSQIDKIIHLGYEDDDHKTLNEALQKTGDEIKIKFANNELK